jgi:hypothetical protein
MFHNLLASILGKTHTLTTQYHVFLQALTRHYRLQLQQELDAHLSIKPIHILRSIQLISFNWFHAKCANLSPCPPDFSDIL